MSNISKNMDNLLASLQTEDVVASKSEAWVALTADNSNVLPATYKAQSKTLYDSVVANASKDGFSTAAKKDEQVLQSVAWDAFYWTINGVTYEEAIRVYEDRDQKADDKYDITLAKFNEYSGLSVKEGDKTIDGLIGGLTDRLKNALSESDRVVLTAIEYSEY